MNKDADIKRMILILRRHYKACRAPVTTLGRCRGKDPFKTLVSTILSSRTLDQTTIAACRRLFKVVRSGDDLRRISLRSLERLIYPVGFYRVKARQLKELPGALDRLFGGRIPETAGNLARLPGVGRKTANLVAAQAFGRAEICVDVHVHRISNRLGLVRTKTPAGTEEALKRVIPKRYWRDLNHLLVAFGQTVCRPLHPKCRECPLNKYCRWAGKISPGKWRRNV
jgi:endonuclease-3